MSEALLKALKELGRVVLLSILPIIIDSVSSGQFSWRVLAVTAGLAGLRFLDKYLHELAPDGEAGGLVRF